jgi:predicted nucleotidyltransferase
MLETQIHTELYSLIKKAAITLKSFGATDVYLFGSLAKGEYRKDSDIDLAVSGIPAEKFYEAMGRAEDVLDREIDLVDLDEKNQFVDFLKSHGELHHVT